MCRILPIIVVFLSTIVSCESFAKTISIRKNVPFGEQFKEDNTVYLIKEQIDLNGAMVIMPSNSTLKFKRKGLIANGTLQGNETHLSGRPHFDGVRLKGDFATREFCASWSSARSISDFIEDVMNLGGESSIIVDCDITLSDQKRYVDHLYLKGKKKTITNSDRYYITYGGTSISDLKYRWDKGPVQEPKDNYSAVVIYWDLLQKDTTIAVSIKNVHADGGRYSSFFMKQYKSSIEPNLTTLNDIENCLFENFNRGVIWTCGGSGKVTNCQFQNIGYDDSSTLLSVISLRLGYSNVAGDGAKAFGYEVNNCTFDNIVSAYNQNNDGRELHGLLAYGDSIIIRNNEFMRLSTSFSNAFDTGRDSEILYIKGSWNVIENNYFKDGAGTLSDGVVTLKSIDSEGNVLRNNHFLTKVSNSKFVYVAGKSVIIEGNEFKSISATPSADMSYAIYLGHHVENDGEESAKISNNSFSFPSTSNYMAIYANRRGNCTIENNTFQNPQKLLKNNNREGNLIFQNNRVFFENQQGQTNDNLIEITSAGGTIAKVERNEFIITNSVTGKIVNGSNYQFNNNKMYVVNSTLQSILKGSETMIEVKENEISISGESNIDRNVIVDEVDSSLIIVEGNRVLGRELGNVRK